jgi:glycine cleavage system H protein
MTFPPELKYTRDHEWLRIEKDTGTIGITDYAQGELGDVVFVELPEIGKQIEKGEPFGTVEAVKAVSDLYAPVTGEVVEVNKELESASELVNKEPYTRGWMIKVRLKDQAEVAALLDAAKYRAHVGK